MSSLEPIVFPDPPLSDGTIALRALRPSDIAGLQEHLCDADVQTYTSIPPDQAIEGTARWVASRIRAASDGLDATFAIVDADTGELLGSIEVERSADDAAIGSIGYWLFETVRRRGIMTRALRLASEWAFRGMALSRLQVTVHESNTASRRVAEKAGYQLEGLMRSVAEQHGRRVDLLMFARVAEDPEPKEAAR